MNYYKRLAKGVRNIVPTPNANAKKRVLCMNCTLPQNMKILVDGKEIMTLKNNLNQR